MDEGLSTLLPTAYRLLPTELHLHTCYSFLEGASQPEELVRAAAELGYRALAITDHDGLHGAMAFAQACAAAEIQAIIGVELTLRHGLYDAASGPVHLTLLAETPRGYANLCRLITQAHRSSPRDAVALDPTFLEGHTIGVIALSGCRRGEVSRLVDAGRFADAVEALHRLACLFGPNNAFVELQHNLVMGDTGRVARLAELARYVRLGAVATGNVHYHVRERHRLQDAMVAVKHRTTLEASHRLRRPNSEFFLRSQEQVAELFAAYPQALATATLIAERCREFALTDRRRLGYNFPDFTRRAHERDSSADEILADYCRSKLEERYPRAGTPPELREKARAQLDDELALVAKHHLAGFFLIYRDLQDLATEVAREVRGQGTIRDASGLPPGRGRGSSVSSIICYLIGLSHVNPLNPGMRPPPMRCPQCLPCPECERQNPAHASTPPPIAPASLRVPTSRQTLIDPGPMPCQHRCPHVDPAKNRLFFNRFLNEDLATVPDIDLDFAREIREQLILRVYERYDPDHAALVCSFATYHLRSAVRDLGKVLGLPAAALDKLAKLSEGGGADTVRKELERLPEFQGRAAGPLWNLLVELAEEIDDFPRHVSQHVGGMIISSRPVIELVPVQPAAMEGRFICQWDKDSCDDARFVKIDFLALGMLSLVEECLELIYESRGKKVDLSCISYDDPEVYEAICRGDTVGLFQIESRAQIQMLPRTRPRSLDELAVQVAIVRPGPIVGGAVNPYVRRRERLRDDPGYQPQADHPALQELLEDTLGIVLYQDQVLEVAIRIGGFTAGQADRFRRAMSRRRSRDAMEGFREQFVRGAAEKHQMAEREAQAIFDKLIGFSEFGFPKSHAYAFAILAYQSAWLRRYYPAEYYAALFNNQPMGFYSPHVLVGDAKRHGLAVLRVAINRSGVTCVPGGDNILLGLTTVRGINKELARALIAERQANGDYRSLPDLLRRTGLPRQAAENLIAVGALGDFGLSRRELLWQLGLLLPRVASHSVPLATRHRQLALTLPTEQDMVHLKDMEEWERAIADYGLLGLSPSYHPLGLLRERLADDMLTSAQLRASWDGLRVRTAGMVVCRQRPGTAKGFVFLLLEDETGITNVVVRPDLYEAQRSVVRAEPYLCVEGTLQLRSGTLNLLATDITSLIDLPGVRLPRPPLRHAYPGNPLDPREAAARPPASRPSPSPPDPLRLPVLASHNFH